MFEDQTVELLPARTVMSRWGGGGGGGTNGSGGGGGRGGDSITAVIVNIEGDGDNTVMIGDTTGAAGGAGGEGGAGGTGGAGA
jgi:hypothetical protein